MFELLKTCLAGCFSLSNEHTKEDNKKFLSHSSSPKVANTKIINTDIYYEISLTDDNESSTIGSMNYQVEEM